MKKQLIVLLLILMATVGLSTAASAVPVTPTTQGPATVSHVGLNPVGGHWVPIKSFQVRINPPSLSSLIAIYNLRYRSINRPIYPPRPPFNRIKVTGKAIGPHLAVITIWKWVPYTHVLRR